MAAMSASYLNCPSKSHPSYATTELIPRRAEMSASHLKCPYKIHPSYATTEPIPRMVRNVVGDGIVTNLHVFAGIENVDRIFIEVARGADVNANYYYTRGYSKSLRPFPKPRYGSAKNDQKLRQATPLHVAAELSKLRSIEALISLGADINSYEYKVGSTPLAAAAKMGHKEVVLYLLELGAKVDVYFAEVSALSEAARLAQPDSVALLLKAGSKDRGKALWFAITKSKDETRPEMRARYLQITKLIIKSGYNVNVKIDEYPNYTSYLREAVKANSLGAVRLLLEADANPLSGGECAFCYDWRTDPTDLCALHLASSGKQYPAMIPFLEKGLFTTNDVMEFDIHECVSSIQEQCPDEVPCLLRSIGSEDLQVIWRRALETEDQQMVYLLLKNRLVVPQDEGSPLVQAAQRWLVSEWFAFIHIVTWTTDPLPSSEPDTSSSSLSQWFWSWLPNA